MVAEQEFSKSGKLELNYNYMCDLGQLKFLNLITFISKIGVIVLLEGLI